MTDFVATSQSTKFAAEVPTFPKLASVKPSQQKEIGVALKKGRVFLYMCVLVFWDLVFLVTA